METERWRDRKIKGKETRVREMERQKSEIERWADGRMR
jgi:hypothetical protein